MNGLIVIDAADMRFINRMNERYEKIFGRLQAAQKAASERVEDLAIDGYGIIYDQALIYDDEIWVFEPGCFSNSLKAGNEIHFQLDHDEKQRLASTRNALSFADDETGLAFRLELDDLKNGAELKRMVDTGRRACISVGIRNEETHIKMFGKHPVRIITKAELVEVSLVGAGKCPNAFAGTVRASREPLERGKKGAMFTINFTAHKLKQMKPAVAEHVEKMRGLALRLDRLEGKATAVEKTESNIDRWYKKWNASFYAESPNITKWAKTQNAAA
jgi:HK97 family phage prohead protease